MAEYGLINYTTADINKLLDKINKLTIENSVVNSLNPIASKAVLDLRDDLLALINQEKSFGTLSNVGNWADLAAPEDRVLIQLKGSILWTSKNLSEIVSNNNNFSELFEKVNIGTEEKPTWAIKAKYGLFTDQFLSSKGLSTGESGGGGGLDENLLWTILGDGENPNKQINISHLTDALANYATINYVDDIKNTINADISSLSQRVTEHINNTEIHVTQELKDTINKIASWFAEDENGNIYTKDYSLSDGIVKHRGFYSNSFVSSKGLAEGNIGGGGLDETLLWQILGNTGDEQISKTHLTTALSNYITTASADGKYATKVELSNYATIESLNQTNANVTAITDKLNDFLEGSDTDTIINKWKELEAFLNGMSESDNLAEILATKADITWTQEQLDLKLDKSTFNDLFEKVQLSDGNYAIRAKYGFYSDNFVSSKGLSYDIGAGLTGDITINIGDESYKSENGVVTLPPYPEVTELAWNNITGKPTTLAGYGITDAVTLTTEQSINGQKTFSKVIYQGTSLANRRAISFVDTSNNAIFADVNGSTILRGSNIRFQLVNGTDIVKINGTDVLINGNTSYHTGNLSWNNLQEKPTTWDWDNITNKPFTYTPSSHTHTKSEITDFPTTWSWFDITGKPTSLSGYNIMDGVNKVVINGDGNAITSAIITFHTLTLTKGSTFMLSSEKTGLLTSLYSNSTTNLSITVGGTTKTISNLYSTYANRLLNTYTIWGQNFYGNNVSGTLSGVSGIQFTGTGKFNIDNLGSFTATSNSDSYVWKVRRFTGESCLSVSSTSGNVGIGKNPSSEYKLDIDGSSNFGGAQYIRGNSFMYGNYWFMTGTSGYGVYFAPQTNGSLFINGHYNNTYQKAFITINYTTGYIGVGTSSAEYKLHVNGTLYASSNITCSSNISASGAITAKSVSDIRLKNIIPTKVDYQQKLLDLGDVVDFYYNDTAINRNTGAVDRERHIGLIYQNAVKLNLVNFCHQDNDGFGSINYIAPDYINLIAGACQLNILGLRALAKRTESIEQRVARLEKENIELKQKLDAYEKSNPMVS